MGKKVFITLAIAALSALLGQRVSNLRKRSLATRELVNNHLPNCSLLTSLDHGSEDIAITDQGMAFISTGLKIPGMPSSDGPGEIFYMDLESPETEPVKLKIDGELDVESFNPHGISTYLDISDDTIYLFVVNHPQQRSQVEVFIFMEDDLTLVHLKTIDHELLHSVNDIVAVDPESFYATNDHYFSNGALKGIVEPLLAQPWSNVVYFSPEEVKVVSEGYYFANGINLSPGKSHLYVVDLLDHKVHVLKRNDDDSLSSVKAVEVGSLCDNVEVDPESGDLWLGCHPNGWKAFMMDPADPPGSEVIRIEDIHSDKPVVTQVYMDDGHVLMGSSVAAHYDETLLIGTVFHKTLRCTLE